MTAFSMGVSNLQTDSSGAPSIRSAVPSGSRRASASGWSVVVGACPADSKTTAASAVTNRTRRFAKRSTRSFWVAGMDMVNALWKAENI
jgi:hypothetical protein